MALVFAAVLPHSPLLVPNIGKDNTAQFNQTLVAGEQMAKNLEEANVDTIVILTTKGPALTNGFTINIAPEFKANLEAFGDLVTHWEFNGDVILSGQLREKLEANSNFLLATDTGLDYASAVSLSLLGAAAKKSIVPLTTAETDLAQNISFGETLQKYILEHTKRIAVIASADLSHRLSKQSPLGYSAKAKKFDQKIIEMLRTGDTKALAESSQAATDAACEDMSVLAILLGLLSDVSYEAKTLAYESPFGVGHLSLQYQLGSDSY